MKIDEKLMTKETSRAKEYKAAIDQKNEKRMKRKI